MIKKKTTRYGQKYDFARKPKKTSLFDDRKILAKPCGWRRSDISGELYFENRKNRSDKNRKRRI